MKKFFSIQSVLMALTVLSVNLSAQNWSESYKYDSWNSSDDDFAHAASLINGDVLFLSNRSDFDHGTIKVKRCGKFEKPYSLFRGHGNEVIQITDLGTERWAGVPAYSSDASFMAVPVWSSECNEGVAGIQLEVYEQSSASNADVTFEGKSWNRVHTYGFPDFNSAQQPAFASNEPKLYFSGEAYDKSDADVYVVDLTSAGFDYYAMNQINSGEDEVYPTSFGDTLFFSRSSDRANLDLVGFYGGSEFTLPEVTNSNAHDFNLIAFSNDSAWVNTRRANNQTDLWVLVAPEPVIEEVVEEPAPMDDIIIAGTFTDPAAAEEMAAALVGLDNLPGRVSVSFDGTNYSVIINPEKEKVETCMAVIAAIAPSAVHQRIPVKPAGIELEIYFDFDKSVVRAGEAKDIREYLAAIDPEKGTFELVGHTDSRGTSLYNLELGLRRAISVNEFVKAELKKDIESSELSRSEWDLQKPCPDGVRCPEVDHQLNRRVVLTFVPFEDAK